MLYTYFDVVIQPALELMWRILFSNKTHGFTYTSSHFFLIYSTSVCYLHISVNVMHTLIYWACHTLIYRCFASWDRLCVCFFSIYSFAVQPKHFSKTMSVCVQCVPNARQVTERRVSMWNMSVITQRERIKNCQLFLITPNTCVYLCLGMRLDDVFVCSPNDFYCHWRKIWI